MEGSVAAGRNALAASDPVMAALIERLGELSLETRLARRPAFGAFEALARTITGQQISTRAAASVYARLAALYDAGHPTPEQTLGMDIGKLRSAGLSRRKAEYLKDLALRSSTGELELGRLDQLPDEEVIEEIVAVRGLGPWSAEAFLISHLRRPDVIPSGDLGIRRSIQVEYELEQMPTPAEVIKRSQPWRPHRTLASVYLWGSLAGDAAG